MWTQWYTGADNCTGSDCHITLSSLSTLPTGGYKWRVLGLFETDLHLIGAVDPARTGPVGAGHRVIQARDVACVPCRSRACNASQHLACMKNILVEDVANAVVEMEAERRTTRAVSGISRTAEKLS